MEMCDLLEVYSSGERDALKRTHGIFMKESELSTADVEDSYEFVDEDTLRYQKIVASSSVETIKMKRGLKVVPNNMVNPQAMYGDVDDISDDDDDDDERISEEGEESDQDSDQEEEEEEESEQEEEEEEEEEEENQEKYYDADKSKSNANKMCKVAEINVDDI